MKHPVTLCLLLVSLLSPTVTHAQPRLSDELVASPEVWRAFHPLVLMTGDDRAAAVTYLRSGHALMKKLDGPIERDKKTETFQTETLASIADFDLKEFYERLPDRDGPHRYFALSGMETPRGYRFEEGKGKAFEVGAASSRRKLGDASSVVRMRHVEADNKFRYLLSFRGGVGVGALRWPALLDGAQDGLALLELRTPYAELPLLLKTADSHLKKSQPALHEEDRQIMARLWGSFPETSKLLTSLSTTDDVVASDKLEGATKLVLITRLDLARMERSYPDLVAFFRRLGNLIESRVRLVDGSGNTLAELFFDSEHMRIRIEAFVREGQLVPSKSGKPLAQAARYDRMRAYVTVHAQSYGLHMYLTDLTVELRSEQHPSGASLALQIDKTPRFRAAGAAFGVFPAGMLDWFVPGDIEGLARRMMDVTMRGNDGRGVTMAARFEAPPGQLATIDGDATVEILDTALIRFGMKIAADRVMPDDDAVAELAQLTRSLRDALGSDLERFARYGR